MSISATFKPSPLSFGSPRTSPFRRPESPASPSTVRATTPTPSPTKVQTPTTTTTRADTPTIGAAVPASRGLSHPGITEAPSSPARPLAATGRGNSWIAKSSGRDNGDALGRLNPVQVRELREAFQMLDRDSDGLVGREDVASILNDLGQDSGPSAVSTFFGPGSSQKLTLPEFLTQLSTLLAAMSRPDELTSAFGAFDDDDNGQINVADLREALLHTPPELGTQRQLSEDEIERVMSGFTGRKTFGKKGLGQGEVFRYQEFIAAVTGVGDKQENGRI